MAEPYTTPQAVRNFVGVTPPMLDLQDDTDLDAELVSWIAQAQEMVDEYVQVSWDEFYPGDDGDIVKEPVPRGVVNGVLRIVGNMVAQAKVRRQSGILSLDEFRQIMIPDQVFTDSIKQDLDPYFMGGRKHRRTEPSTGRGFSMTVVNRHTVDRIAARNQT